LNQKPTGPPAELTKPVGTLPPFKQSATEKKNPHVFGSKEGPWNNVNINAQVMGGPPAELTKPVGTLPPFEQSATEKKNPHVFSSKEGPWNNVNMNA
jgi:hypothetical protein